MTSKAHYCPKCANCTFEASGEQTKPISAMTSNEIEQYLAERRKAERERKQIEIRNAQNRLYWAAVAFLEICDDESLDLRAVSNIASNFKPF